MNSHAHQYFHRAAWALHNATNAQLEPIVRSHLTAMAVHACQSLKERLDQLAADTADELFATALKNLPHTQLIENTRNSDLHGWPLPVCDPRAVSMTMVSKPGHPIQLMSSHGVGVSLQMHGPAPKVRRAPKDLKHANVTFAQAVSYQCEGGKLFVHDFCTGKNYLLLEVLDAFLQQCQPLVQDRASVTGTPAEENPR
jgi:hypothetical protein